MPFRPLRASRSPRTPGHLAGSEKLLFLPGWKGLVGTVVLPILGAVPDGAIVLFSGMGPNAQTELTVGVGALAGSTVMLLTLPWFLSILGGRVDMEVPGGQMYVVAPKARADTRPLRAVLICAVHGLLRHDCSAQCQ